MTPIILAELQYAVFDAAETNKLPRKEDEAVKAFQGVASASRLAVMSDTNTDISQAFGAVDLLGFGQAISSLNFNG
ncbi:hypothetical protein PITCH_A1520014 [uncultured Desulfobacterium sp.]|uniref:Uncharacterized protein n=1 Tax=uncultured Desulfobacterium sp. TaxID=201089 RepID=A0A445MTG3_9BACT|nr:hypothetical protein PITCH_A1520014 [uncultured Desulfobacterium sp.]